MISGWILFSVSLLVFLVALIRYFRLVAFLLGEVHGFIVEPVDGSENQFDFRPAYFGESDQRTDEERYLGWNSEGKAFRFSDKTGEQVEFEPSDLERREIDLWLKIERWRSVFWWAAVVAIGLLALNTYAFIDWRWF